MSERERGRRKKEEERCVCERVYFIQSGNWDGWSTEGCVHEGMHVKGSCMEFM